MSEPTPMFVAYEVKEIRRFIDENIDSLRRDVLRRTIHRMLDRVCEAADNRNSEYQKHLAKQAEIMAETARRNVRLEAALKPVMDVHITEDDMTMDVFDSKMDAVQCVNVVRSVQAAMKEVKV